MGGGEIPPGTKIYGAPDPLPSSQSLVVSCMPLIVSSFTYDVAEGDIVWKPELIARLNEFSVPEKEIRVFEKKDRCKNRVMT